MYIYMSQTFKCGMTVSCSLKLLSYFNLLLFKIASWSQDKRYYENNNLLLQSLQMSSINTYPVSCSQCLNSLFWNIYFPLLFSKLYIISKISEFIIVCKREGLPASHASIINSVTSKIESSSHDTSVCISFMRGK